MSVQLRPGMLIQNTVDVSLEFILHYDRIAAEFGRNEDGSHFEWWASLVWYAVTGNHYMGTADNNHDWNWWWHLIAEPLREMEEMSVQFEPGMLIRDEVGNSLRLILHYWDHHCSGPNSTERWASHVWYAVSDRHYAVNTENGITWNEWLHPIA